MGRQSSTLQGKPARSLFIGKPVVLRSPMARLGALRGDLRCLSATFMVVIFFCCVLMLSFQPSRYPTKLSMVDLPKDEVVRAQSIAALSPNDSHTAKSKAAGPGKDGKKGGKGDAKVGKSDKKAMKAKWIKDELPKKLHVGRVRNNTKTSSKADQDVSKENGTEEKIPLAPFGNVDAQSDLVPQSVTFPQPGAEEEEEDEPPATPSRPLRPRDSFSNLSEEPVHAFASPFIESKTKGGGEKKKVITWHRAADERQVVRLKKALENCPEPQCKLVYPLPDAVRADAVVFEDLDWETSPPARTSRDQVFILHTMNPQSFYGQGSRHTAWSSAFNWTWSYRNDSDIWQPLGLLKRSKKVKPLDYFDALTKLKSRAVAWMPRTCAETTASKRNEFVKELSRHVHVMEFGPCFNRSCAKPGFSCSDTLTKKFFFLLAVEDDLCKDHVTEVFYRAWQDKTHVLPVVRGGADYATYFPEGTYIDTAWFDSAKQLSEFMVELVASRKTYTQLLWRKAHWVQSPKRPDELSMCKLCHKLHNLPSDRKWYSNIQNWFDKSACKNPRPF